MKGHYLIGYDITNPRRLARLFRRLKRYATPIQYSLFLGTMTEARLNQCIKDIKLIIDPKRDDVRIYPLPQNYWSRRCGRAITPPGVVHTGLPLEWTQMTAIPGDEAINNQPALAAKGKGDRRDPLALKMIKTIQTGQKNGLLLIK